MSANFIGESSISACATAPDGYTFVAGGKLGEINFFPPGGVQDIVT
jgi:hypothetical protein